MNPQSKSPLLARDIEKGWEGADLGVSLLDLEESELPRFVYVASEDWEADVFSDPVGERIGEFATSFEDLVRRLR